MVNYWGREKEHLCGKEENKVFINIILHLNNHVTTLHIF